MGGNRSDCQSWQAMVSLSRRPLSCPRTPARLLANFRQGAKLSAATRKGSWEGPLVTGARPLPLSQIASVLYRRPTPFELDPALPPSGQQYASAEARMAGSSSKGVGRRYRTLAICE